MTRNERHSLWLLAAFLLMMALVLTCGGCAPAHYIDDFQGCDTLTYPPGGCYEIAQETTKR